MRRPSPRIILAVIAFGVFVAADDLTVVSTMLRQIIFDLEIPLPDGLDDAAWIVNAYLIAYVVVMPFIGRVSDIVGRRPVFIASLVLFLAGSIWLPNAPDLPTFIAGRVLTALGGGAMVPVGMAIVGDIYPPEKRPSALGILGAIDTAGWVWGPLYGALLVRFLDWRWQFYLNIPLSLIGIAAAWWALRDLPRPRRRAGLDWLGTAVLTVTLVSLNIALLNSGDIQSVSTLNQLSESEQPLTWPLYLLAACGFIAFIFIQRRLSNKQTADPMTKSPPPLIDLGLFQRPNFSPAVLINLLVGTILIIAMINVPLLIVAGSKAADEGGTKRRAVARSSIANASESIRRM
jgi:MFS family permease